MSGDAQANGTLRTVTFLCTDIEGSTSLWEEHTEAMRRSLARHDALLGDAVTAHGGTIFKTTGDGAYATLPSVASAVEAAVDAMRALSVESWGETGPLAVRMCIHIGEVEARDGDYYGLALNRVSRLLNAAHGGQIVLTGAAAATISEDPGEGLELVDLGLHRLRGIAEPVRAFQLSITGLPSTFPPLESLDALPSNLPNVRPSFARTTEELVDRRSERDVLEEAWSRADGGARHVALVAGEPGIGKSRLVAELANLVYAQDRPVLYGRCDEDAVVPYQPFVEALQPYVAAYPAASLHERLHGLEQELTRLFPDLLGRTLEPPPRASDPEAERYRLFEAITSLLTGIAASSPTLLVLDDVHWADRPTVQLLRHVVRATADAHLLVVVCYRDVEVMQAREVSDLLADLRREVFTVQVTLGGLPDTDAETLLRNLAGHDVASELARGLNHDAGGNPFFLCELLRNLLDTDPALLDATDGRAVDLGALGLPQSVRDLVTRRVRRLPPEVNDVLTLASVIGPDFSTSLLARAGGWPAADVLLALDRAKDAGLVDEHMGRLGTYAFTHHIFRQALYTELGNAARVQLHARVGTAMEDAPEGYSPATLAEHFGHAAVIGEGAKALRYTTAAARDAAAHLALEDAAAYFQQALALHDQHAPGDAAGRVDLLIELAEVLTFVDEAEGVRAARLAVDAARAEGSAEQLGRAVAVFSEPITSVFSHPDEVESLLDEAQDAIGDGQPALRARLLAIQAFKYSAYQLQGRDGRALADQAVRIAREAGDASTLTAALFARATSLESTDRIDERIALGEELVALGGRDGSRAAMATTQGLRVLAGVHLERGDGEALRTAITDLGRAGEELRWLPALAFAAQWQATQALLEGRFDDVRSCWDEMRRHARAYRAVGVFEAQQSYYLARDVGELGDHVRPLEQFATGSTDSHYVLAMLALARLDSGDERGAQALLDDLDADELRGGAREPAWGAVLALLSEVSAATGSTAHAEVLYEQLEPFAGRLLATVIGLACLGAAQRYQGMLATALERFDDASAHFARASELEAGIEGHALLPRTRYWEARMLRARGDADDQGRADELLRSVTRDAERLGMARLHEQAAALLAS